MENKLANPARVKPGEPKDAYLDDRQGTWIS